MANIYGTIAPSGKLTFDKSFARANGQPLDASEVYYSLAEAENYAKTAIAYVGQKIVVVEDQVTGKDDEGKDIVSKVVTQYYVADEAGNLVRLNQAYAGIEKSIVVNADNTISLYGAGALDFDRDILDENGEVIGTEKIQYQPLMTDAGLVWVEPSKTTVEGLATLIEALTKRVDNLEADVEELQGIVVKPIEGAEPKPEENLWDAIDAEVTRATKAEEALGKRIDAIDFIDAEELAEELKKKADKSVVDAMYTNAKIDELIQEAKDYADENDANDNTTYTISYEEKVDGEDGHPARIKLTPSVGEATYVDATPFIKDGMLDKVEYDADTNTLTFTFNTDAGKEEIPVELTDILAPYDYGDTHTISVNIDDKNIITAKVIEKSITEAYLSDPVNADIQKGVEAHEFVGEDLIDVEGGLKSLLDGKQDTLVAEEDYATPDQVNAAQETAQDYTDEQLKAYYTIEQITALNHATETFVTEAVAAEAEIARAAEKTNKEAIEAEAETARAAEKENKDAIAAIKDDANVDSFADVVAELAKKQNNLTAEVDYATPGQVSAAKSEATGYTDNKIGNIDTNTVKDYVDKVNTSLTNHITNEYNVLAGTVAGHTTSINKNTTDIAALVTKVAIEDGKIGTLETAVAGKVDQTTYDVLAQQVGTNTGNISTLQTKQSELETTVSNQGKDISTLDANKANKTEVYTTNQVYTKTEVDAITGERAIKTPAEGDTPAVYKTLAEMISDVNTQAEANKDAIAILNGKVDEEGSVKKIAADAAKAEVAAVVDAAPDAFDTLKEIAEWIQADETASEALAGQVTDNAEAIVELDKRLDAVEPLVQDATLKTKEDGTVEPVKGIITPEDNKFEMTDGKVTGVSTDLLFNGDNTLVLFGGSATA